MARPRKPTEILKLNGAFKENPNRTRPVGAKSKRALGMPPKRLSEAELEVWVEIEGNAADGVLTSADRYVLELMARLVARLRADWLTGAEMSQLTWCISHLGMTPSDRSKVLADGGDPEASPFDEFMQ